MLTLFLRLRRRLVPGDSLRWGPKTSVYPTLINHALTDENLPLPHCANSLQELSSRIGFHNAALAAVSNAARAMCSESF